MQLRSVIFGTWALAMGCGSDPVVFLGHDLAPFVKESDASTPHDAGDVSSVHDAGIATLYDAGVSTAHDAGGGATATDAGDASVSPITDAATPSDAGAMSNDAQVTDASKPLDHECTEFETVCGSDNKNYMNRCVAEDAGVSVVKRGPC